jgi:hypothetical protein
MKKSALIIAFLLVGFFGFGQNNRPYVIRYQSQGDTIQHNTQAVSGIHIDTLGHELNYGEGTEWSSLADMDTVYVYRGDEIVNPAYVPIDWDNTTLVQANDSLGNYQMQFGGEAPELVAGSIIAIDQDTVVHYVYVESVTVDGNTVTLSSTEANLTDIFADVEFTLATNPNRRSSAQGQVFYPVAIYQRDEQGGYRPMNLNQRDLRWGFTHNLWHYGQNFNGEELFSGNNYSVYMEHMNFDFDIDLEIYMNFGGRDIFEIVGNALEVYRSRALNVNAALLGTFSTEQRVRCDIEGSCSYSPDYDIWKHKVFQPFDIKFVVYGVPVVITVNSDLYRQVELTASGEISAYAGFSDQAQGRVGFQWRQTGGMTPVASFSNTFELTPPTVEGRGEVTAKVWAIPRVRLILYHFIGPSFDFKPYLSTSVSGGFHEQMLGQTNDFCAWSLDCNTGLDAACGLSIMHPIFDGYEIENFSTPNWNIIDRPLYHSPLRIEHNANRNGTRIGQRSELSFTVYDRNHLFNTDVVTPLPQFVKFEGDGDISSEYGIANNGTVSVDWTPLNDGDVLYARLYDVDGNVISEAEVNAELTVTTLAVTNITQNSATGGGEITANDYVTVEERGLCWNTSGAPTIGDNHANSGTGTGSFTVNMTDLTANTTYHVRAYTYLGGEWYYGNEVSFNTLDEPDPEDWVDLGLPSGLLWATRNVGASSPANFGDHFAWGETNPKSVYYWNTYAYLYYDNDGHLHITKYNSNSNYGPVDNLTTLQPGDDAATANYGGRMPTYDDWVELIDNCTSVWTKLNGVNGRLFTGPNGSTLFLPAAGCRWNTDFIGTFGGGRYWSSSLSASYPGFACSFCFDSANNYLYESEQRFYGLSVRAVREN